MTGSVQKTVAETVAERVAGDRVSRARALLVAGIAGVSAALLIYRFLRSAPAAERDD